MSSIRKLKRQKNKNKNESKPKTYNDGLIDGRREAVMVFGDVLDQFVKRKGIGPATKKTLLECMEEIPHAVKGVAE